MSIQIDHFAHVDPPLGRFIAKVGPLPPRKYGYPDPYRALIFSVSHQQIHAKAAEAILGRLTSACGGSIPQPDDLLVLPEASLRSYGFSAAKIAALRDIATKTLEGTIPSRAQALKLSDAELIKRLTTTRGVGRWTVEMLLIFTLERPDILPVDDFGVREGYRLIHNLSDQPKPKIFRERGQIYSPHATLATLYFWHAATQAKLDKTARANAAKANL